MPLPAPSSLSPNPVALNPAAAAPRLLSAAPKPGLNGSIHPSASARAIPAGAAGSACPSTNNPPQSIPEPGHQTPSSPSCHLPCPQQCPQGSGIPKAPGFPGENTQSEIVAKKKKPPEKEANREGAHHSLPLPLLLSQPSHTPSPFSLNSERWNTTLHPGPDPFFPYPSSSSIQDAPGTSPRVPLPSQAPASDFKEGKLMKSSCWEFQKDDECASVPEQSQG